MIMKKFFITTFLIFLTSNTLAAQFDDSFKEMNMIFQKKSEDNFKDSESKKRELKVLLTFPETKVKLGQPIYSKITIINVSDHIVKLNASLQAGVVVYFRIIDENDKQVVPKYLIDSAPPPESNFIRLFPGVQITAEYNLADEYSFTNIGNYQVKAFYSPLNFGRKDVWNESVVSEPVQLTIVK